MFTTVEEVIQAYESTKLIPIEATFLSNDHTCACPLSTLYAYKTSKEKLISDVNDHTEDSFLSKFAVELLPDDVVNKEDCLISFYEGFDKLKFLMPSEDSNEYSYYKLGSEVRDAIEERMGVR
jgi:hypothetical protein